MQLDQLPKIIHTHQPITHGKGAKHYWNAESVYAVIAAVAANRPLLVMGETGLGKSQLAAAAAQVLDRNFLSVVIQPRGEPQDLLWSYDYTARLADSQLQSRSLLPDDNYLCPGALWWALNPVSAADPRYKRHQFAPPWGLLSKPETRQKAQAGSVLLIDEIDKADSGLANSLLETLGERRFSVPHLAEPIAADADCPHPLVVFTSNEDRELPSPFLRRCTVLRLHMPSDVESHFMQIGACRFPGMSEQVLEMAAEQIARDREQCKLRPRTGLAEYIDLLSALDNLSGEVDPAECEACQLDWLDKLAGYFKKSDA